MKRFMSVLLLVAMAMLMTACAGRQQYQMGAQPQQQFTEQDIMGRIPYPFSINVGPGKQYTINGKSDTPEKSWINFVAALKDKPAEFSVWMVPKLVQEIQYNNDVRSLFADLGYTCKNEGFIKQDFTFQTKKGKKAFGEKKTFQLYQMDFVWTGEPKSAAHTEQSSRQGNKPPSFNWNKFWGYLLPAALTAGAVVACCSNRWITIVMLLKLACLMHASFFIA